MADRTFVFEADPTHSPLFGDYRHGAVQRQRSRSEGDVQVIAPGFVPGEASFLGPETAFSGRRESIPVTPFVSRSWEAILVADVASKLALRKVSSRGLRRRSRSFGDAADVTSLPETWKSLLEGGVKSARPTPRSRSLSDADSPRLSRSRTFPSVFGHGDASRRRHSTGDWEKETRNSLESTTLQAKLPRAARLTSLKVADLGEVKVVKRKEPKEAGGEEKLLQRGRQLLEKAGTYLKDAGTVTVTTGVWSCGDNLLQHLAFHGTGRSLKQQIQLLLAGKVGGKVSIRTRVPLAVGRDMLANAFSIATYDVLSSHGAPQVVASTAGTFAASAVTVPAWHLSYLLKTGAASTPRQALELFIESQGVEGLFAGLVPTVVRSIPTSFVMSGTHSALKRLLSKAKKSDDTNLLDVFMLGAAAGFASSVTCLSIDAFGKSVPTLLLKRARASVIACALERAAGQVAAQTFSKGMLVGIGTTGLSYVVDDCTGKVLQKLEERARAPQRGRISTDLPSLAIQRALEGHHQQRSDGQDGSHGHADHRTSFEVDLSNHHMQAEMSMARPVMAAA